MNSMMKSAKVDTEETKKPPRQVPAFSVASYQKNVHTGSPPLSGAWRPRPIPVSRFHQCYLSCDCPIQLEFLSNGQKLSWKVELERLDFNYYLPIFFSGLMETRHPYAFLARQAVHDMLTHGGSKVPPVIPQLVIPLITALNTRHPRIVATAIKALQLLIKSHPSSGPALLPYYRQILPTFNLFVNRNVNLGDGFEYSERKRLNVADLIKETLEMMEKTGGPHARRPLVGFSSGDLCSFTSSHASIHSSPSTISGSTTMNKSSCIMPTRSASLTLRPRRPKSCPSRRHPATVVRMLPR